VTTTYQSFINLEKNLLRAANRFRANYRQPERYTQHRETHSVMDEEFRSKFATPFSASMRRRFPS